MACALFWCLLRLGKVALLFSAGKFCFLGVMSICLGVGDRNGKITTRVD